MTRCQWSRRPFELWWDLDVNGSYETTGTLALFSAAHRDGPFQIHVPALARHPAGGPTAQTTATITVRNVKPRLTLFRVLGGDGQQLNAHQMPGHEPSVLMGLPVTIEAEFTDPGVLDRQATKATTVRVISPEQAVEMVVAQLDVVIAATSDENARQNLEQARRALVGSDLASGAGRSR